MILVILRRSYFISYDSVWLGSEIEREREREVPLSVDCVVNLVKKRSSGMFLNVLREALRTCTFDDASL